MLRFCREKPRPNAEFLLAASTVEGDHTVDLHAQLRDTGRVLDAAKVVLGGSSIIRVNINLGAAIPSPRLAGWRMSYQVWPRDIVIRRNMASSNWQDLEAMVAGRDAEIFDQEGAGIPANELLGILGDLEEPNAASLRWAVVIGDDAGVHLQLQSLPAGAPTLNGKPLLRK